MLHDQVEYLRGVSEARDQELEARTEELRRNDHIIAALTERIPELEPTSEPPDARQTPAEGPRKGRGVNQPLVARAHSTARRGGASCSAGRSLRRASQPLTATLDLG
jgi:hypothetical protein